MQAQILFKGDFEHSMFEVVRVHETQNLDPMMIRAVIRITDDEYIHVKIKKYADYNKRLPETVEV